MKLYFKITTLDAIIMSETNTSTNNHQCLDYIPGSALLGLAAKQLYSQLSEAESWQIFHSGDVQFGPSYPISNNTVTLPTPASWHNEKYNADKLSNHAAASFERENLVQYKQCRTGFINPQAVAAQVKQSLVTKTALDATTLSAKEGSLFSYSAIEANQSFLAWVEVPNSDIAATIKPLLQGQHRLGRSRNNEFGRVNIAFIDTVEHNSPATTDTPNTLVLWALSDIQCINAQGLPTYTPTLSDLLPGAQGQLDTSNSFIQAHQVNRFNQKRAGLDSEQALISKGSVLVFNQVDISDEQLSQLHNTGVGINKQQGLGWVMVNPLWAQQSTIEYSKQGDSVFKPMLSLPAIKQEKSTPSKPCSPLTQWADAQLQINSADAIRQEQSDNTLKIIINAYNNARKYNNILHAYEAGPSSSQWRRIMQLLRDKNSDVKQALFGAAHGICKASNDELGWGITWHNGDTLISFAEFFEKLVTPLDENSLLLICEKLCRYDLSVYKDLQRALKELNLATPIKEQA